MLNIKQLNKVGGVEVSPNSKKSINDIDKAEIKKILEKYGVVLFHGFDSDAQKYSDFLKSLCKKVTLDPAREFVSKTAQLVDSGYDEIPLHCENGLTPFLPDALLFFCEIPASSGSATTYCDGQLVWNELSEKARNYFKSHQFYFNRTIPKKLFEKYVANEYQIQDLSSITPEFYNQIIKAFPQHQLEIQPNGDLIANLNIALVHKTKFSNDLAFANSLIGPSYNYQKPVIHDENGEEIPQEFYDEFKMVSDRLTADILWNKNDMVLIDNTRFMHGRRKIEDKNRRLYAGMGYL